MKLDNVEKFEDLSFAQWIALGNHCGGLKKVKSVLRGSSAITVEKISCFSDLTSIITIDTGVRDISNFFEDPEGFQMSEKFQQFILNAATKDLVDVEDFEIGYSDLVRKVEDSEIVVELPKRSVFEDVNDFLSLLGAMINMQRDGEDGVLLNTDFKASIFYVKGIGGARFSVHLYWHPGLNRWHCGTYRFGECSWKSGWRVFSAIDFLGV